MEAREDDVSNVFKQRNNLDSLLISTCGVEADILLKENSVSVKENIMEKSWCISHWVSEQ